MLQAAAVGLPLVGRCGVGLAREASRAAAASARTEQSRGEHGGAALGRSSHQTQHDDIHTLDMSPDMEQQLRAAVAAWALCASILLAKEFLRGVLSYSALLRALPSPPLAI